MSNLTKCKRRECKGPLYPFNNDEAVNPESGYLIITGGQRCGLCGQVYDSDGKRVDMSKIKMRRGCP